MGAQHKRPGTQARQGRRERALARLEKGWPAVLDTARVLDTAHERNPGLRGPTGAVYLNARTRELNHLRRNLGLEPRTDLRAPLNQHP